MNNQLAGERGPGLEEKKSVPNIICQGRMHLLAIGINEYKNQEFWKPLNHPVRDCERLFKVLKERYALASQEILLNKQATYHALMEKLEEMTSPNEQGILPIGPEDSLIIYFAGHGHRYKEKGGSGHLSEKGALVLYDTKDPKDADKPENLFLDCEMLAEWVSKFKAGHILLILDACFGGLFQNLEVTLPAELIPTNPRNDVDTPSRWILTSGRWEPVPDKSYFSEILADLLRNNKSDITIDSLIEELRNRIKLLNQFKLKSQPIPNPYLKKLVKDLDGGDFLFELGDETRKGIVEEQSLSLSELLKKRSASYRQSLMMGRFRYLRIEQVLLPESTIPIVQNVEVSIDQEKLKLTDALETLWKRKQRQAVILGSGGAGKTVSLLNIWEELLDNASGPIPIYIPLNAYNIADDVEKKNFIFHYIAKHYLGEPEATAESINRLWNYFKLESKTYKAPSLVLLLDGYNEITSNEKSKLDEELWQLYAMSMQVQWIVTSRFVEIKNFEWARQSTVLELQSLSRATIENYLNHSVVNFPETNEMWELLENPMALTCYVGTESALLEFKDDIEFIFYKPKRFAELLWNFQEVQLAQAKKRKSSELDYTFSKLLLKYFLPYIAWRMEKYGHYFLPIKELDNSDFHLGKLVEDWIGTAITKGFINEFPSIVKMKDELQLESRDGFSSLVRKVKIQETLLYHLKAMVREGDELGFIHQNFRDFYAASHLLNCIKVSLAVERRPIEWQERAFPIYLRKMIGELEGEYLFDPYLMLETKSIDPPKRIKENWLTKLTVQCRGPADMTADFTVWNLVTILHETRGTLAGADLSSLDLRRLQFNQIQFSIFTGREYLTPKFEKSKINGSQFFLHGHSESISNVKYGNNDQFFISYSNYDVREWLVETGELTKVISHEKNKIIYAGYEENGRKIVTVSESLDLVEWSGSGVFSSINYNPVDFPQGKFKRRFSRKGFIAFTQMDLKSVIISKDYQKFCTISNEGNVEEWIIDSAEKYEYSSKVIFGTKALAYSPNGQFILCVTKQGSVKEIDCATRSVSFEYKYSGEGATFATYSPQGNRVLIISRDYHVEEFCKFSSTAIFSFEIHTSKVTSVCYSPCGSKVLIATTDGDVKQWSCSQKRCLSAYHKIFPGIISINYSSDGRRFLAASDKGSINEFSIDSGRLANSYNLNSDIEIVSISVSNKFRHLLVLYRNGTIELWNLIKRACVNTFLLNKQGFESIIISPNGQNFVSFGDNLGVFKYWSSSTGKNIHTFIGHRSKVISVIFSENGERVLSISLDRTVKEWCSLSGNLIHSFPTHKTKAILTIYSVCGKMILIISEDGTAEMWSSIKGKLIYIFPKTKKGYSTAAFSPNGMYILLGTNDGRILKYLLDNFIVLDDRQIHQGPLNSIAFSNLNKLFLTCALDGCINIYSERDFCLIHRFFIVESNDSTCRSGINFLSFSPKDTHLIFRQLNGELKEYLLSTDKYVLNTASGVKWMQESYQGLFIQGVDFRKLSKDARFNFREKIDLNKYGAIFNDQDKSNWEAAVKDAYGDMVE
ncbi:caspase family protein [uncultured Algoriphagus sp.]|uniref:caspase family protein n=1 Tax=uncultured Algoriphagus sp. TaxID=417365 RepID=UPI0030EDDF65